MINPQAIDTAVRRFPFLLKKVAELIPAALDRRHKYKKNMIKLGYKHNIDDDLFNGWMYLDIGALLFADRPSLYRSICDEYKRVVAG